MPIVNGSAPSVIGQSKRRSTVASVYSPQKGKQRVILTDGQQLTIAKCPAARRKIARKKTDFANEGIQAAANGPVIVSRGIDPLQSDDIVQGQVRLHICVSLAAARAARRIT